VTPSPRVDLAALAAELPRGDGHAVLVLPAALRGDGLTREARSLLARLGYAAYGWDLGIDFGPTPRLVRGCQRRLAALAARHGPVSLLGFSMGGLFARWLAVRTPWLVRRVITVGSPFRSPLASTALPSGLLCSLWGGAARVRSLAATIARPLRVPGTFLYSRRDGLVAWECCRDPMPASDNVEFSGCHISMVRSPEVLRIVGDRLARPVA
jgi:pimeloyl-ACP methyl ester carboxylesterase